MTFQIKAPALAIGRVDLDRLHNLATAGAAMLPPRADKVTGKTWYQIENKADAAEIFIYDMIGDWGVTAADFITDLKAVDAKTITLRINSEGGEVFDGIAIYEALARNSAHIDGIVDGLAASAASFIAMACDTLEVAKNARMMIHDASGLCWGNAKQMRAMADLLEDLSDNIASIYTERAGGDVKDWRAKMTAETWYSAQAAVDAGLADKVGASAAARPSRQQSDGEPEDVAPVVPQALADDAEQLELPDFAEIFTSAFTK